MKYRPIVLESAEEFPNYLDQAHLPERGLLAAVLERSLRDLDIVAKSERHFKRTAIAWFEGKLNEPDGYSFEDVIYALGLTIGQVEFINDKVDKARNVKLHGTDS